MESEKDSIDADKARRRKSESTGLFSTLINRSTSSLTRSKSQERKSRVSEASAVSSIPSTIPGVMYPTVSRMPIFSSSTGTYQNPVSRSIYMHGNVPVQRHSSSQSPSPSPSSPTSPSSRLPSYASRSRTSTSPSSPRTTRAQSPPSASRGLSRIPQTSPASPSTYRHKPPANAISAAPSSSGSRPNSPSSNSSKGKRVFGILLPSSNTSRKASASADLGRGERKHQSRSGSGSSNEPLLPTVSRTSSEQYDRGGGIIRPAPLSVVDSVTESQSSISRARTPSRRDNEHLMIDVEGTPKARGPSLRDMERTPRPSVARPTTSSPTGYKGKRHEGTPTHIHHHIENGTTSHTLKLASPQARAPATFLPQPIPRLNRIPATPEKGRTNERPSKPRTQMAPRVDSFMSDSLPVPTSSDPARLSPPSKDVTYVTRHPAFACPVIERSKSAPAKESQSKGRTSPCFRIPSPKLFNSHSKEGRSRERSKERKVTPESVGSPIVRDTRMLPGEKQSAMARISQRVRRTAHGSFDFERPGSRGSSKSAYSESKSGKSDDEKEKPVMKEKSANRFSFMGKSSTEKKKDAKRPESPKLPSKYKASSPVPPLPTCTVSHRANGRSPPPRPRTRSPQQNGASVTSSQEDDSVLPRLSSSLGRKGTSRVSHRAHSSHPSFTFERPQRVLQEVSTKTASKSLTQKSRGPLIDTQTGLMWRRSNMKENTIPEGARVAHRRSVRDGRISPRAMEEATAVIASLKDALNDAGFARLQTYVTRFDAQIIPLEGPSGLIVRVQRLLESSAPLVDAGRKRQLLDTFIRVVSEGS